MPSSRAATPEEKRITEEKLIQALRSGRLRFPDLVKVVATVRYSNGTKRGAMVKRTIQDLKARGIVEVCNKTYWQLTEKPAPAEPVKSFGLTPAMISGTWGY